MIAFVPLSGKKYPILGALAHGLLVHICCYYPNASVRIFHNLSQGRFHPLTQFPLTGVQPQIWYEKSVFGVSVILITQLLVVT